MAINAGKAEVTVVGKFKDDISSKSKKAFDKLKSGAQAAFKAATVAVAGFTAGMALAISKANEQELAIAKLEGALRATGKFTRELSRDMQEMASGFQAASTTGDEAILSMQSLLFAMGATTDNIKQVTQATLDLSAGMGVQASGAALLFGKALSGDFGTLSRYGILVSDIEGNSNKLAAALAQVQQKFGGQAQAQANTFGGKMKQVANSFGDMLEEIGFLITKDERFIDILKETVVWITQMSTAIKENRTFLRALGTDIFSDVKKIWYPFGEAIKFIVLGFKSVATASIHLRGMFNQLTGDVEEANEMFAISAKMFKEMEESLSPAADAMMGVSRGASASAKAIEATTTAITTAKPMLDAHIKTWEEFNRLSDKKLKDMGEELIFNLKMKALRFEDNEQLATRLELIRQAEKVGGRKLREEELSGMTIFLSKQREVNDAIERQNKITEFGSRVFDNFRDGMLRTLQDGQDMWQAFKNVALSALFDIQAEMLKVALFDPIKKAAGSALSGLVNTGVNSFFGGGFAHGGDISGGAPVLVGERGPEMFTPSSAGHITPNNELGGGITIVQNISAGVSQTIRTEMMALMPVFIDQAMNVIAEERQRSVSFSSQMGI